MSNNSNLKDRTLTLTRTFKAPIALVWEAWTQAEHVAKWWGPKGMNVTVIEHNFEVGGKWEYAMAMPDGSLFTSDGVYSIIEEFKRIHSSANFKPMTEGVEIQAIFEEAGDETHFTFHCVHATAEYCKQQEQMGFYTGWGSVFDRLAEFVNK